MRFVKMILVAVLALAFLAGCAQQNKNDKSKECERQSLQK